MREPLILAIDTSCDDTSAAVTRGSEVLSNVIASQTQLHKPYGGVFPTVAKLAHKENIDRTISIALQRAQVSLEMVDAVAVTVGPGLAPALEVGIATAKTLAKRYAKPLIPVNHVEGHVLSVLAHPAIKNTSTRKQTEAAQLPALSIIVSGGHTEFVLVTELGKYEILGSTLDDAAGECLDKIGRMLNLGYPAGPVMEEFAKLGNAAAYPFPLPLTTVKTFDLSFSGMKTFARNTIDALTSEQPLNKQQTYDFCASAQHGVFRHICYKLQKVLEAQVVTEDQAMTADTASKTAHRAYPIQELWLGGGVAANMTLRKMLRETARTFTTKHKFTPIRLKTPYTKKLCADNAAMIGVVAGVWLKNNGTSSSKPSLLEIESIERKPRLSL